MRTQEAVVHTSYYRMPTCAWIMVVLNVLIGIGGLVGGILLLVDTSGRLLGLETDLLAGSPVSNFLIPGLFLTLVVGAGSLITAVALIRRPVWHRLDRLERRTGEHWAWWLAVTLGGTLIVWIGVQVPLMGLVAWLHPVVAASGLAIIVLAVQPHVRRFYAGS